MGHDATSGHLNQLALGTKAQGHPRPAQHQSSDGGRYPAGHNAPEGDPSVVQNLAQVLDRQPSHGLDQRAGVRDQQAAFAEPGAAKATDWPANVPASYSEAFVRLSGNHPEVMQSPKFSNRINFDKIRDIESLEEIREVRREI